MAPKTQTEADLYEAIMAKLAGNKMDVIWLRDGDMPAAAAGIEVNADDKMTITIQGSKRFSISKTSDRPIPVFLGGEDHTRITR